MNTKGGAGKGHSASTPFAPPTLGTQPSPAHPLHSHHQASAMLCLYLGCHPLGLTHLFPGQLMGQGQFCSTR